MSAVSTSVMTWSLPTIALSTLATSFWKASANQVACSCVTGMSLFSILCVVRRRSAERHARPLVAAEPRGGEGAGGAAHPDAHRGALREGAGGAVGADRLAAGDVDALA